MRKKAVLALIRLESVAQGSVDKFSEITENALRDGDPSVMMAVLPHYLQLSQAQPEKCSGLLGVFLKVFQQLVDKKLPREYEYEGHSSPWAMMQLL